MIFQSLHQQLLYSYHTLCDMAGKMNFERHVVSLGRCSLISGDYSRAYIRATTGEPPTAAESCIDESVSERPSFNSNFNSSFNESNSCFSKRDSVIQWLLQYKHPNNSWCSKKVIEISAYNTTCFQVGFLLWTHVNHVSVISDLFYKWFTFLTGNACSIILCLHVRQTCLILVSTPSRKY